MSRGQKWIVDPSQMNPDTGLMGKLVLAEDFVPTNVRLSGGPVSDLYMDGTRATDGTDIGSRAKRRAYMKAHGLADADDFKQTWSPEAQAKRAEAATREQRAARVEAIQRAMQSPPRRGR